MSLINDRLAFLQTAIIFHRSVRKNQLVKNGSEKFFPKAIDRNMKKLKLANKLIIQMNIYLKPLIDALQSDLQKICNVKKY